MFDLKSNERLFRVNWQISENVAESSGSFWFAVENKIPIGEEEEALRLAIKSYYDKVPDGQEEAIRGYDPNWGDAINDVNFEGSGFRLLDLPICPSSNVDHDEAVYDFDARGNQSHQF